MTEKHQAETGSQTKTDSLPVNKQQNNINPQPDAVPQTCVGSKAARGLQTNGGTKDDIERQAETSHTIEAKLNSGTRPQIEHSVRLINNESLSTDTNVLTLSAPELARTSLPGQFVQLKVKNYYLRRPIGVMSVDREQGLVQLGIRRVGKGSNDLCDLPVDSLLDVVGPLGHGFELPFAEGKDSTAAEEEYCLITVGGGTGLFPLIYLLEDAKKRGLQTIALAGFKSPAEAILLERMQETAGRCISSSDIGGLDFTGNVAAAFASVLKVVLSSTSCSQSGYSPDTFTAVLKGELTNKTDKRLCNGSDAFTAVLKGASVLADEAGDVPTAVHKNTLNFTTSDGKPKKLLVYACGPVAMLENIAVQCQEHNIPCQVSLEARMACGLGVCVGCSIPVYKLASLNKARSKADTSKTTYERCCYDGPVFPAERIVWPSQGGIW
ncbi:MAG TPA: hypothetical protein GXZ59_02735 [Clostridiaceae bacterium]|nr:hypothetical protein [Clostridiaceae bacterium]